MARLVVPAACCAVFSIGLVACSSSTEDYQKEAEKYLESDDFAAEVNGMSFTDADCEVPASTSTGATYTCTAAAEDGSTWSFDLEITGKNELTVTNFVPGGDNAQAPSVSVPAPADTANLASTPAAQVSVPATPATT